MSDILTMSPKEYRAAEEQMREIEKERVQKIKTLKWKVQAVRASREKTKKHSSKKSSIVGDAQTVKNIEQHVRSFRIAMPLDRGSIFSRKSRFFK